MHFPILRIAPHLMWLLSLQVAVSIAIDFNVSYNGLMNGGATATAYGGTPPYSYTWSIGDTTPTIAGLIAGIHSAAAVDNSGF